MKNAQVFTDKLAISLSVLCALHCLAFPFIVVLVPSIGALNLDGEAFHLWMIIAVIPTSLFALTIGCKQHKRYRLLLIGLVGVCLLVLALLLESLGFGEVVAKALTVLGACAIAYGHYSNYQLCRSKPSCTCSE